MASLVDSIRSMTGDSWWIVKIAFFSAVLFFILYESYYYPPDNTPMMAFYSIIGMLFLGCASITVNRNINNKSPLFPSLFSIPEIIIKSICSTIAILPGLLLYYLCMVFVQTSFEFEPFVMAVIYICITAVFSPFIFVPVVLYSVRSKLSDVT
ncbi:MAG: hypothetical protein LUH05_02785, partial [Candidatus Gastranaerophilales bacterium]|nr:hypothetical protein [Candidatus Gastranaerophilales bacterium]